MLRRHALGTTLLAICSAPVCAQSNVTIYGILDVGISYINNEGGLKHYKFADGVNSGNRLGFRGTEDLGGGTRAIFTLENGFNLATGTAGQGGRLFGRQAFVGLQDTKFGTLTMGRQYDFIREYTLPYNVGGFASVYAGHQGDYDRISGKQMNNSVKYVTPNYGGFEAGGMYSFGEVAGRFHDKSAWSSGASYVAGPLKIGTSYTRLNDVSIYPYAQTGVFSFLGQTVATAGAAGAVDLYPATGAGFVVDKQSIFGLGGSYTLNDALTLVANTTAINFKAANASSTMHIYEGGAIYRFTPTVLGIFGFQRANFEGKHWNQPTIGTRYYLSKRTSLYASASYLKATSGVNASQGAGFYMNPSSTNHQTTVRIAMAHTF